MRRVRVHHDFRDVGDAPLSMSRKITGIIPVSMAF
ncbi:hypothetical protein DVU_2248 [Nitratidesulfovibrio vulgaris str. Hildenborough]|uniref:Uncharacterized protein n=1 Tax=Nitratidesulfovibrio vulgaris (strain ATCC 29579 / DSM 644 / CCUG 34227 / NCIMB 8303 / VKM B-1760 / Hildenborough) TaxID=882 RepID=Q729V0_NITV2|nr:hypothetical protein DVU_2248 [Nitratidesulfovibrio vulgaris str. Hildenborough]